MVIAIPLIYFVNDLWMSNIMDRISYDKWVILLSACLMFLIGLITILPLTLRVASTNPADILRDE